MDGDVRAAFLSGAGFDRELLVLLPRDCGPLLGCDPGQPVHMRMLKRAYGLAEFSRCPSCVVSGKHRDA